MDPILSAILEIFKFVIPSAIVAVICYILISKIVEDNSNRLQLELRKQNSTLMTPLKLQAYERMI